MNGPNLAILQSPAGVISDVRSMIAQTREGVAVRSMHGSLWFNGASARGFEVKSFKMQWEPGDAVHLGGFGWTGGIEGPGAGWPSRLVTVK
jgi:hypothetical protein